MNLKETYFIFKMLKNRFKNLFRKYKGKEATKEAEKLEKEAGDMERQWDNALLTHKYTPMDFEIGNLRGKATFITSSPEIAEVGDEILDLYEKAAKLRTKAGDIQGARDDYVRGINYISHLKNRFHIPTKYSEKKEKYFRKHYKLLDRINPENKDYLYMHGGKWKGMTGGSKKSGLESSVDLILATFAGIFILASIATSSLAINGFVIFNNENYSQNVLGIGLFLFGLILTFIFLKRKK